jgi:signal transduction histidine kinase/CheY-like chemotaxis protein
MNSTQSLDTWLDTISDPFGAFAAIRDEQGRIVDFRLEYVNLAGAAMKADTGPRAAQLGKRLLDLLPTSRPIGLFAELVRLVETGESMRRVFQVQNGRDSGTRTFEVAASRIGDGFVCQWRDVSQYARTEQVLRDSGEDLRALNETLELRVAERTAEAQARARQLHGLALALADAEARERKRLAQVLHDHFQQLLSAAKLKAGLVRRMVADNDIQEAVRKVELLIKDAIDTSRSLTADLNPPVLYDAGLNAALEALAQNMQQRYGLNITVNTDPRAEPVIEQVKVLLFEAIRELLTNVVHHARANAATVSSTLLSDGRIEFVVSDNGQGFDMASLAARQQPSDTPAFGLFEIRERLSFIGGNLKINSESGKGTRVSLTVPAELRPGSAEPRPAAAVPAGDSRRLRPLDPARSAKVIVADDHRIFREGLIALLSHEPMLVVVGECGDGEQTVHLTRQLRPDLLLLDITMPGMNGIEVASILSREIPDLRIVGLSMHKGHDMASAMLNAGAMAYVTKGGSSDKLLETLRGLLWQDGVPASTPP